MTRMWYKTRTYMVKNEIFGEKDMQIGYEESIDDLCIMLLDDYEYDSSIEVDSGFIVDVDKNNRMVAIEILDCSKKINKSKKYIKDAKIEVFTEIYEHSYKIIVSFNDGEKEISRVVLK